MDQRLNNLPDLPIPKSTKSPNLQSIYGFTLAPYNPHHPLIIDPLLASTFLGSSG